MIWLFAAVGAAAVVCIALAAVGHAVGRLEHETAPTVYRVGDAAEYVAARLPDQVTARVSYDDVRTVLGWHLEWFSSVGLATPHVTELGDAAVAVGDTAVADADAALDAVVARSIEAGGPDPVDVVCILEGQLGYLAAIGAVAESAEPADLRDLQAGGSQPGDAQAGDQQPGVGKTA